MLNELCNSDAREELATALRYDIHFFNFHTVFFLFSYLGHVTVDFMTYAAVKIAARLKIRLQDKSTNSRKHV